MLISQDDLKIVTWVMDTNTRVIEKVAYFIGKEKNWWWEEINNSKLYIPLRAYYSCYR